MIAVVDESVPVDSTDREIERELTMARATAALGAQEAREKFMEARAVRVELERSGVLIPVQALERAQQLAAEAGLLLVVGSSLEVHPVAARPGETLAGGGALALVNHDGTPWDSGAELALDARAGETLRAVAAALDILVSDG